MRRAVIQQRKKQPIKSQKRGGYGFALENSMPQTTSMIGSESIKIKIRSSIKQEIAFPTRVTWLTHYLISCQCFPPHVNWLLLAKWKLMYSTRSHSSHNLDAFHSLHRIWIRTTRRNATSLPHLSLSRVCMHSMRLRGRKCIGNICVWCVRCCSGMWKKLIQINRSTRHIFHYHHSLLYAAASLRILIVSFDQISRHKRDIHHSVRSSLYRFPHVYFHDTRISPPLISSSTSSGSLILLCWTVAVGFMCWFISYSNF